jgi:chromate transporter
MSEAFGLHLPARREALRYWWRLGWTSFGGPAGQIALMHRDLVERRRWIDETAFLRGLNFCTLLPGPEAQQLATYIGWRLHGPCGGVAAGALFVLPSVAILLALAAAYVVWGHLPAVVAALSGIQAAVVAIVAEAIVRIGRRTLARPAALSIAAAAFLALRGLGVPFPAIVAAALAAGALLRRALVHVHAGGAPPVAPAAASRPIALGRLVGAGLALWGLGLAVALAAGTTARQVYLFFTQAAFVTFGGAYTVLAYVGEVAVDRRGWLTAQQMIDGLAFAETTPGPLIMVLQWVGFLAGWTSQGGAAWGSAILCALLATWATFLPGFVFVLAGAPAVERLASSPRLAGALAGVTAAAVGMILDLALRLGGAVLFSGGELDGPALAIALAAGAALLSGRVSILALVGAGALAGLLRQLV